jgi:uncharacterized protein YceH (UPF0502 family)
MIAKKVLKSLMGEQKDIGKLKQNNDILKKEMQSLKAMLSAQAKEGASNLAHNKEIEEKQAEIEKLDKRVKELEKEVAENKATIEKLEADLAAQKEIAMQASMVQESPAVQASAANTEGAPAMPSLPKNYVSPEVVVKHKKHLVSLESELRAERNLRREADGEIIKLRAAINGVELNAKEVDALLAQKVEEAPKKAAFRYVFHPFSIYWRKLLFFQFL